MIRILFIGDISGVEGKRAIQSEVNKLVKDNKIDYVIANAENTTKGRGLSWKDYELLKSCGIDFFTMGNHTWRVSDIYEILETKNDIIRPYNINPIHKESYTGLGTKLINIKGCNFRITNLLDESIIIRKFENFIKPAFVEFDNLLKEIGEEKSIHIVDLHAETTSFKTAFFLNFSGKVHAILGTHTHVQTNDHKILNNTAYITDVGMTGAVYGVIGIKKESVIDLFYKRNETFRLEEEVGKYQLSCVILDFDEVNKKTLNIKNLIIYEN